MSKSIVKGICIVEHGAYAVNIFLLMRLGGAVVTLLDFWTDDQYEHYHFTSLNLNLKSKCQVSPERRVLDLESDIQGFSTHWGPIWALLPKLCVCKKKNVIVLSFVYILFCA